MSTVGERIAIARTRRELSQPKLGKLVGRSVTTVTHWEDDTSGIKLEDAVKVCRVLGVSLEWLAAWEEDMDKTERKIVRYRK